MLAHLRVGTRGGDIHQCCLLSNSNVFSPLICSEASAEKKQNKKGRSGGGGVLESICCLIYFSSDGVSVRVPANPLGYILECMIWAFITNQLVFCESDCSSEDQPRMTTVLAFSSHYLMAYPHGPHCQSRCQPTPSFISFSLSLRSLCHFLASVLAAPPPRSVRSLCPLHLLHYVSTFPLSLIPLSPSH